MECLKMDCSTMYNGYEFRVSKKYLYVYSPFKGQKDHKYELTSMIISKLKEIKDSFNHDDANRTYAVLKLTDFLDQIK